MHRGNVTKAKFCICLCNWSLCCLCVYNCQLCLKVNCGFVFVHVFAFLFSWWVFLFEVWTQRGDSSAFKRSILILTYPNIPVHSIAFTKRFDQKNEKNISVFALFKCKVGQPHSLCVDTKGRSSAFKTSFFILTDPDIPKNSIAFYNRSDQRKGKMKPPPNPFTQVQEEYFKANTHNNWFLS